MNTNITSFRGKYNFLSNFYDAPILFNNIVYKSVEYAYQCDKMINQENHDLVYNEYTPGRAKQLANKLPVKKTWNTEYKLKLMNELLILKFTQHLDLRKKLIDTKDYTLIENNNWGDVFWGVCNNKGENFLGRLLMNIRDNLINNKI